ncbi:hypothetical protein OSB04_017141 [Centaurea solstitialis]|uniref:Reverse transcriptase Ty1/copia-type domain-containing protein n=1 Tax=Centaurea solstitialis TaxID=347529 RepID=A0AA38TFI5_9ASTR|nr:hypothetical protein OSB04_017141 [Centaurea solstitialis]
MHAEFDALECNRTWSLVPSSHTQNIIGNKWVYHTKYKLDGSIDHLKARLVAKGFHQRPGINYIETFSQVIKPATLHLVLSLAIFHTWSLRQLDINNAFLQGHLKEDIYMDQPSGFINPSFPNHVCKLNKAIYSLCQASRDWYDELKSYLISLSFKATISDPSLFFLNTHSSLILVLVYVDDIIVIDPSPILGVATLNYHGFQFQHVSTFFIWFRFQQFSLKDLGSLYYFLGVEVVPCHHGIILSQRKYILDILHKANMRDCKPISTQMTTSEPLTLKGGTSYPSPTNYRTFVGALQYLSLTCSYISFTVNKLSQFMHADNSKIIHVLVVSVLEAIERKSTKSCEKVGKKCKSDPESFRVLEAYIFAL